MDKSEFDVALIPGMRERLAAAYAKFRAVLATFQETESRVATRVATRERCPACDDPASNAEALFVSRAMTHVRCRQCAQVYTLEVLEAEDDQALYQANSAMQAYRALKEDPGYAWLESTKAAYLAALVRRHRAEAGTFLDIGCSTGQLLVAARDLGFDVYGLEANPGMIAPARERFGAHVAEGYFPAAIPGDWPTFDVIAILDLLEHMVEPKVFLSKLSENLAPGGLLLVQVPNFDSLVVQLEGDASAVYCHGHWLHFTSRTLSNLLQRAGFEALWQETIISELDRVVVFPPARIASTLRRLAPEYSGGIEGLNADAIHRAFLGFKLIGIFRKR